MTRGSLASLLALAILWPLAEVPASAQAQVGPLVGSAGRGQATDSSSSSSSGPTSAPPPQGSFSGSVPVKLVLEVLQISLQDAIDRGLKQNLGVLLSGYETGAARGQRWQQLSNLLPHLSASPYAAVSQVNLAEFGFKFNLPPSAGFSIPTVVGPFSYVDARANLTQTIFDWQSVERLRAANQNVQSVAYSYKDARDLVVLSVGFAYLQAIADNARIETSDAQVKTAQALYDQASDQLKAGTSPAIDALRAEVELKTRQQQLIQAKNDFAIQKLSVARVIGLPPGQQFELTDQSPYQPFEVLTLEDALKRAYASRSDYQAALADVRSAEYTAKAARAEHYPSLGVSGDYGVAGQHLTSSSHGVFDFRATLTIPIFAGGTAHADALQASAQLEENQAKLDNLRAQIDDDVQTALLNLQSSSDQVGVTLSNIDLAEQSLTQSRDRFAAGVTDTVEVVQAQEAVASAHESYISSLYNFNYAKISLARALGMAEEGVKQYFKGK
jgi:outer membrane protein TolC